MFESCLSKPRRMYSMAVKVATSPMALALETASTRPLLRSANTVQWLAGTVAPNASSTSAAKFSAPMAFISATLRSWPGGGGRGGSGSSFIAG